MRDFNRPIFRPEALRRYVESREEVVTLGSISPRRLVGLWLLLGLLAAVGGLAWVAAGLTVARVEHFPAAARLLALVGRVSPGEIGGWTERLLWFLPLFGRSAGA